MAVGQSKFKTPDGVERDLRFSQAAQFRASLEKDKSGAIPDYFIAWAMMFDEDDNPPLFRDGHPRVGQTMTAGWLGANLSPIEVVRLRAAIAEATTGAALEKKIVDRMEKEALAQIQKLAGEITGLSVELPSDSQEAPQAPSDSSESSGGLPPESSTHYVNGTPSANETP